VSESTSTLGSLVVGTARERILEAAYDLFSRHGLQSVGVNMIVERAGLAKKTLDRLATIREFLDDWPERQASHRKSAACCSSASTRASSSSRAVRSSAAFSP
jgi:hypothetical protein